jgi:A/G-specific adenine glycosylase
MSPHGLMVRTCYNAPGMQGERLESMMARIAAPLLAWWDSGHDALPWRETDDPYAIWVSEVMLQQTQVATVIPYYERWLARFPTVEALAAASLDAVLKVWEGLGYYARARNLHRAAGQIVEEWGGQLPSEPRALQRLPGIGRYTAGAIASIAYGRRVAALDGNIIRVLARLIDLDEDVTRSATKRRLWALAESAVPADRPGDYNQALMELGRKVCRPARAGSPEPSHPHCHLCPLGTICQARAAGTQLERPVRPARKRVPHYQVTAAVVWRDGNQVLIAQRPVDDMLGGLWEFPGGKQQGQESLRDCLKREIREELGIEIEVGDPFLRIKHAYTHFRITLHVFHCRLVSGRPQPIEVADFAWVTLDQLERYPFPVTDQQIMAALHNT